MSYQPDPRYFDFGGQFSAGIQQSQENKRQNALLEMQQQQYGLNERRVSAEEARLAQSEKERLAAMQSQKQREGIGLRALAAARGDKQSGAELLQELGLPTELADDPDAGEMYQAIAEQYGGFSAPPQQRLPSSFEEFQLGQANPAFAAYLSAQRKPVNPGFGAAQSGINPATQQPDMFILDDAGNQRWLGTKPIETATDKRLKVNAEKEADAKKTATRILDAEIRNVDLLIGSDDGKTKMHRGFKVMAGSIQGRLPSWTQGPMMQASDDAMALLNSLKSKASINSLREIRSGGSQSIGTITEREWPRLEGMKVALDEKQSDKQLYEQLKEYRDNLRAIRSAVDQAEIEGASPAQGEYDYVPGNGLVPRGQ